jgi:HSP20 family protein
LNVLIGKVARELAALEEQLDRAFERAFSTAMRLPGRGDSFRPTIDAYETKTGTVVRVDLAGVDSKDIRLIVDGEYLQISGRRTASYAQPPEHHLQMEIPQGNFERVVRLRVPYDPERVAANLDAGILTIELPSREPTTRKIPVRPA